MDGWKYPKKIIAVLLLILMFNVSVSAYTYPETLYLLLVQFSSQHTEIVIVTTNNVTYTGVVKLAQDDYILFETSCGMVVITIPNIVEISQN